jgi:hypothetical protein
MPLDANALLASFAVSGAGFVAFVYGKRQGRVPQLVVGLALMVFPYFVDNAWIVLGVGGALLVLLWIAVRAGL